MSEQMVYFTAMKTAFFTRNRHLYRVYCFPNEMLFLKIGIDVGAANAATVRGGGAIGAGIGALLAARRNRETATRLQSLQNATAEELRGFGNEWKGSFSTTIDELTDVQLDRPSFWKMTAPHTGFIKFRHNSRGKFTLVLFGGEDASIASEELRKAFGEKLKANAKWDPAKNQLA